MTRSSPLALLVIIALSAGLTLEVPMPESIIPPGKSPCKGPGCATPGEPYAGRGCLPVNQCPPTRHHG
ncbi:hypothetical protein Pst134EA_030683 [Puccinia striiformis f. sp. tritici]|uniref:Uncharacterized protein n=2 Tax=Puccinia striiformis TaxID=27350 RepID=A0A0L0VZS0_9BASI|nr:hypothetical protein Pst134EA_030683 [Puccinia striiformis f. sp. tritici]KAH9446778.1 hypothetical protein Pst134EA_030683 [Puccinia striiformis f. sp. tritici]KNF04768.1 hypothetical protein PSTG_02246 [Puccinia striiformis f. sp. tritici PST-78]